MFIDKFKDAEIPTKQVVGKVEIANQKHDLIFYTEIKKEKRMRQASMLLRDEKGTERGLPNMTYLLSKPELICMLKRAGFSEINEINLESEKHFDILLAKK